MLLFAGLVGGSWVAWQRADSLISNFAQPYLARAGLPEARVALKGLSWVGTTIELYEKADSASPLLAVTLPFNTLRATKLVIARAVVRVPEVTGGGPLPDPLALLRLPLPLERLPWQEVEVTEWELLSPLAAIGHAHFAKTKLGYEITGEASVPQLAQLNGLVITGSLSGGHSKASVKAQIIAAGGSAGTLPVTELTGDVNCQKLCEVKGGGKLADLPFKFTASSNFVSTNAVVSMKDASFIGVPLTNVEAKVKLKGAVLDVQSASGSIYSGMVRLAPFTTKLPIKLVEGSVRAEGLDLAALLALAKVEGLSGGGSLSGTLPFRWDGAAITLMKAELTTAAPGQLAYAPLEPPSFMAEGGQGALLGQVFRNFHYKTLKFGLNGTLGQDLQLSARVDGKNPDFYSGHPVAFNLNLSGALDTMLKNGLATSNLSAEGISELMKMEEGKKP